MASATDAETSERHGALMMAAISKAPVKCTTVGVANALTDSGGGRLRILATSVTTRNWMPTSAAPEDPMMT